MSAGSISAGAHLGAWWRGRFGRRLLLEIALLFSLLTLYRFGRYLGRNNVQEAFEHARDVLHLERHLGIFREQRIQDLLLDHVPAIKLLNRYYAVVHFPATVAFIAVVYVRTPELYSRIRFVFVSVTGVGLATQILYPLAPPRMMAGFVDTIARWGPAIYTRSDVASVANQYAAMPSIHVGWALIVAYGLWQMTRSRWRWIGVAHAAITSFAVVATANHYWADGLVALGLVVVAVRIVDHRRRGDREAPALPQLAS